MMVKCDKCDNRAVWRINAAAPDGFQQRNAYACEDHKDEVHQELEDSICDVAKKIGRRLFGPVSDIQFLG